VPQCDPVSQKKVRDALLVLSETLPDLRNAGGKRGEVDPIRHLIATASGWGLNPDKDAIYLNVTPKQNDGNTIYHLTVKDVPVDGFWSISVYGADGYFHKNDRDAYTLNNITAKKNEDGSVTVQFGGDANAAPNVLPITPGWNYMVRLYRPRKEILEGTWQFPEAQPANGERGEVMLSGSWVLTKLNGKSIAGRDITLEFDTTAVRASGSTGVNRWSGGYKLNGQSIEFGPLISTRRAGPPEAMKLEHEFTQSLEKVTTAAVKGERLVLSAGDKTLLVFEQTAMN
jgi:heat shock protein HslJ